LSSDGRRRPALLTGDHEKVPVTLTADTPPETRPRGLFVELTQLLRSRLPRRARADEPPTPEHALVRALCHDMRSPLAALEAALCCLDAPAGDHAELVHLARAQTAHLSSMLRTADATGGAVPRRAPGARRLRDVLQASVAASGLPARQLTVEVHGEAGEVAVADARVQRILTNLLENAHRHGGGAAVRLTASRSRGWVDLALTQAGLRAERVADHLRTERPPVDLTGLGLWSVQRLTRELGGRVIWHDDGAALTLTVQLPDR
jgi:signal transduction histidine kinase